MLHQLAFRGQRAARLQFVVVDHRLERATTSRRRIGSAFRIGGLFGALAVPPTTAGLRLRGAAVSDLTLGYARFPRFELRCEDTDSPFNSRPACVERRR
jgi:hypothetical protein